MTPKQRAKYLLEKMNDAAISKSLWDKSSNYAKNDLKRKCLIVVDECLKNFVGLHKPEYCAFDCIVKKRKFTYDGEYDAHMTGYDMENYWKEVKKEIKNY